MADARITEDTPQEIVWVSPKKLLRINSDLFNIPLHQLATVNADYSDSYGTVRIYDNPKTKPLVECTNKHKPSAEKIFSAARDLRNTGTVMDSDKEKEVKGEDFRKIFTTSPIRRACYL